MCKYAKVQTKKPNTLMCANVQISTSAHLHIIL